MLDSIFFPLKSPVLGGCQRQNHHEETHWKPNLKTLCNGGDESTKIATNRVNLDHLGLSCWFQDPTREKGPKNTIKIGEKKQIKRKVH